MAWAQAYPTRPVRLVVPFAAGGSADIAARLVGLSLADRLGQQFIIENRSGAGANIATEAVARAPPDGYTLLIATGANAVGAALYDKLNFNFIADIVPVAGIVRIPFAMQVNPSFPAKTIPEFIDYAKANPGKISFASAGNGTAAHMAAELFKMMTGTDMLHVPYRGGAPALTDLLGGQVQVMFVPVAEAIDHIRTGKLRALAVTTAARSEVLPEVPVIGDSVPGYEASTFVGIGAPRGTPPDVVGKLNHEVNAALTDPRIKAQFAPMAGMMLAGPPTAFGKLISDDIEKWAKVIRAAKIRPE
jgi:tripartite-type tricarboxylate transporter receptor subunit TctC